MTYVSQNLTAERRLIEHVDAASSFDTAFEILQRDGVLIVERAADSKLLARLNDEMEPWFDAACHGAGKFFGRGTRRFSGLLAKSPASAGLVEHPLVLALAEAVLKGDPAAPRCDVVDLNLTQAIGIEPGEDAQFLHRDEELWPFARDFEVMVNVMWAFDDFTTENGATRLIPGSHKWARDRQPELGETVQATAPAGSAIIWLGGVLHAGGANHSDKIRRGAIISYKLGWLAPAEKMLLSVPPAAARALPERTQQLLGYQLHRPNLGWVEGRDPIEWLRGDFGDLAPAADNLTAAHEDLLKHLETSPGEVHRLCFLGPKLWMITRASCSCCLRSTAAATLSKA